MSEPFSPDKTPYDRIGGEQGLRQLVHRFYTLMDQLPEAADIRRLHPESLTGSEEKLFKFLSGWLGGPSLYVKEYGHPMLRKRHLPFAIGKRERDQWMMCMEKALLEQFDDKTLVSALKNALMRTANHMRNQPD